MREFKVYCKQDPSNFFSKVGEFSSEDVAIQYVENEFNTTHKDWIKEYIIAGGQRLLHYKEVSKPSFIKVELKGESINV
jgi:hypothetical protein